MRCPGEVCGETGKRHRLKPNATKFLASGRFCTDCGAANPGCSRLSAGSGDWRFFKWPQRWEVFDLRFLGSKRSQIARRERFRGFHLSGEVFDEVLKTSDRMLKITSEDLGPHQVEHVEEGGTSLFGEVPPFWKAQVFASIASKSRAEQRGQEHQAVSGHLQLRQAAHCFRIADMSFCHS